LNGVCLERCGVNPHKPMNEAAEDEFPSAHRI
jgi:hypothetical protein